MPAQHMHDNAPHVRQQAATTRTRRTFSAHSALPYVLLWYHVIPLVTYLHGMDMVHATGAILNLLQHGGVLQSTAVSTVVWIVHNSLLLFHIAYATEPHVSHTPRTTVPAILQHYHPK